MSTPSLHLTPSIVVAQDLRYRHDGREVLRGLDLTVVPGESLAVVGRGDDAGAPRALFQVLTGLAVPQSGWVHWGRHDIVRLSDTAQSALRRRDVGLAIDTRTLPELPVSENIALPLLLDGHSHRSAVSRAADLLDALDLSGLGARRVSQLSPRDRVLVALGRALVTTPRLVIVDDPTKDLCPEERSQVFDVLFQRCTATGAALLLGTDDPGLANRCVRQVEIADGRTRRLDIHYAAGALL